MIRYFSPAGAVTAVIVFVAAPVAAQSNPVPGGVPMSSLPASERNQLGDPFFDLVLRNSPTATSLKRIEDLIQPNRNQRRAFVVSESIIDPARGQGRRSVLSFRGTRGGHVLDDNVMLSVFFNSEQFTDNPGSIEALGWDSSRGRYNYYLLSGGAWRFAGDSRNAAKLTPSQRNGTCMACHVNGAPIMKELFIPWNNWRSFETTTETSYLTNPAVWPVASSPRLIGNLAGAEVLEGLVIAGINRFMEDQISRLIKRDSNGAIERDADGRETVTDGRRLLRHLFDTTEVNLVSSRTKTGLHPLPIVTSTGPSHPVDIPNTHFLNANLIGGQSVPGFQMRGLGISAARGFSSRAIVQPAEYRKLVNDSGIRLGGRAGDAFFGWFGPEASHIDNFTVEAMMKRGILTPQFVAAVLLVDLETPVMSDDRASLLDALFPQQPPPAATPPTPFKYSPLPQGINFLSGNRHPDSLTTQVIATLESQSPAAGTPAAKLLNNLKAVDPLDRLKSRVEAYSNRIASELSNSATRAAKLKEHHQRLVDRRDKMLKDDVLKHLNESTLLLPRP